MNLCKHPELLRPTGNNARNWCQWCDIKEQLQWFLEGTKSTKKSDGAKTVIMLSHAGKDARKLYKILSWKEKGDEKKFKKVSEGFKVFCSPQRNLLYE